MKLKALILVLCSVVTFGQVNKPLIPTINHVTVFLNQAQIESSVSTNIQVGTTKVLIDDIANTIDPNSISVGGKGDFMIIGVKYSANHLNKKAAMLQDSIKIVKNDIENLEMLASVAQNEQNMIMANANVKSEKDGVSPEELKEMIDFFRTKLTEVGTRKLQIQRQLAPLKDKLQRLENQQSQNRNLNLPLGQIELTLLAQRPTLAQIKINYIAYNAGWAPNYDLRVKDIKGPVNIIYKAGVYQNTGIDWNNVKLTLSSSDPKVSGMKPDLMPQYLSFYNPPVVMQRTMASKVEGLQMADAAPMATPDAVSISTVNKVVETGMSVNFEIGQLYTIPSSGISELVEIQNYSTPADYNISVVPKMGNNGFLTASVKDWEKFKLISGEANVYYDDAFVGKSFIIETNTGQSINLSLGKDARIMAKREEIENYKARKTFGSNVKESFGYKITVRNTKTEASAIVLEDQIPVSQDSDIEVSIDDNSGAEFDAQSGKLTWRFTLQPSESKDFTITYTVKYPKDKRINNL